MPAFWVPESKALALLYPEVRVTFKKQKSYQVTICSKLPEAAYLSWKKVLSPSHGLY